MNDKEKKEFQELKEIVDILNTVIDKLLDMADDSTNTDRELLHRIEEIRHALMKNNIYPSNYE